MIGTQKVLVAPKRKRIVTFWGLCLWVNLAEQAMNSKQLGWNCGLSTKLNNQLTQPSYMAAILTYMSKTEATHEDRSIIYVCMCTNK